MPNKFFNNMHGINYSSSKGPPTGQRGGETAMPDKVANWPGVPGKMQSKDRSGGVKKCKCHPVKQGI